MTNVASSSRHALLARGWYVVSEVELAFMGLSGRAHDLLIILKHMQGGDQDACPTRERLAEILAVSVRTVQNLLNELKRKGAITARRTGRNSRYDVKYIHTSTAELRLLLGAEVQIPGDLQAADVQDPCTSEVQDPGGPLLYKEPPLKNQNYPSLREGGAATEEAGMGMRAARSRSTVVDEFDPMTASGLWESQELPEDAPDSSADPRGPQAAASLRTAPRRAARTQAQLDTPMALAIELDRQIRAAGWNAGPAPVNRSGLARNLSTWKRDGVSADQIRDMINRYVSDTSMHGTGKPPWIDFINKRHKLLAVAARAVEAQATENARDADDSYWLGSMAGER